MVRASYDAGSGWPCGRPGRTVGGLRQARRMSSPRRRSPHTLPRQRLTGPRPAPELGVPVSGATHELLRTFVDAAESPRTQQWLATLPLLGHVETLLDHIGPGRPLDSAGALHVDASLAEAVGVSAIEAENASSVRGRRWIQLWATCAAMQLTTVSGGRLHPGPGLDLWWDHDVVLRGVARQWYVLGYLQRTARPRPDAAGSPDEACRWAIADLLRHMESGSPGGPNGETPSSASCQPPVAAFLHEQVLELADLGLVALGDRVRVPLGGRAAYAALASSLRDDPVAGSSA